MQKLNLQTALLALPLLVFFQCKKSEPPVFKAVAPAQSGVDFVNQLTLDDSLTVLDFEYIFNGGGTALLDVNNDGLQDIFFTGNMVSCRLYLNKGNLKFEDITQKSGISTMLPDGKKAAWCYGASVVDINQDGFKDIYVSVAGNPKTPATEMENFFFINNQNGTFTNRAREMGLSENGHDVQTVFFDMDSDGDLDLYLLKNAFVSYNRNQIRKKQLDGLAASNDKLFRNNGTNAEGIVQFEDVSKAAGITIEGFGLGISACDINEDGLTDLYVSNDFLTNDLVWVNNGNGTFTNKAPQYLKHQTYNAMGNDVADFNNDGNMDLVTVDMLPPDNKRWKLTIMGNRYDEFHQSVAAGYEPQYVRNTLQLNTGFDREGNPTFSEIGQMAGIHATEWSWAPLFADFDNDGWKDLFIANGYRQDVTNLDFIMYGKAALFMGTPEANRKERIEELKKYAGIQVPNVLYRNRRDLTFEDVSKKWGIGNEKTYSNGATYGDLDNDGDLDLIINNLDQTASIFENTTAQTPENQWLRIGFRGEKPNLDGFGAKVWLWQNGQVQYQYFAPMRGYLSTVEPFLHFGLTRNDAQIDSLRVRWADGREQFFENLKSKQMLVLEQKNAAKPPNVGRVLNPSDVKNAANFREVASEKNLVFNHEEDDYLDFKTQALLPHLHSRLGPFLAVGDLDGDKLDDAIVGAAAGFFKKVFFQKADGTFRSVDFFEKNTADDGGLLLFDADGDGDLDLFAAAGGAAAEKNGSDFYQSHLFENDGKGNFSKKTNALPAMNTAAACPTACDFDRDGDLDLFVGGRVSPNEYPLAPRSFLLKNDGKGKFSDATPDFLKNAGMVCAAIWADFDGDGWQDLALAGEFLPVQIFKNEGGQFTHHSSLITHNSFGWWNALAAADFDGDGDMDLVAGNRGTNGFWKANPAEPVQVYAADFDKNGLLDPVMTTFWDGVEQIAHTRDDVNKQITPFRARFRTYTEFAEKTFAKSFRPDEVGAAQKFKAETFASAFLENTGGGHFELKNLPNEAQMSTICAFQIEDFNADGKPDLLCVGNNFSTEVQSGRFDAQGSFVLLNAGGGRFSWHRQMIYADGDCKSVARLRAADGSAVFLIGRNRERLLAFKK